MHPKEDVPADPQPPSTLSGLPPEATMEDPAYAQVLQYWAENTNLLGPNEPCHLAMCLHKLRWVIKLYTTFSNCDIFEGLICETSEVVVKEAMQPNPTKSTPVDDPATLMTAPSVLVDESAALITTPSIPAEKSVTLVTTSVVLTDDPADPTILPGATSDMGKAKDLEYPKWIKDHLSHSVASVGTVLPPWETSGGTATTTAPIRGELGTTWWKKSGSSKMILGQPHLRAPWIQHIMRKKTLEPKQRCCPEDLERLPNP